MHFAEHHFPRRTAGHAPVWDPPFQGPELTGLEPPGVLLLNPVEARFCLKSEFVLQQDLHLRPDLGERILPHPVRALPAHCMMRTAIT